MYLITLDWSSIHCVLMYVLEQNYFIHWHLKHRNKKEMTLSIRSILPLMTEKWFYTFHRFQEYYRVMQMLLYSDIHCNRQEGVCQNDIFLDEEVNTNQEIKWSVLEKCHAFCSKKKRSWWTLVKFPRFCIMRERLSMPIRCIMSVRLYTSLPIPDRPSFRLPVLEFGDVL